MNPYEELNIPCDATEDEIKQAFRDASKLHHPDLGGNKDKFQKLNSAYLILKDPVKRKHFDEFGQEPPKGDPIVERTIAAFNHMVQNLIDTYGEQIVYKNIIKEINNQIESNLTKLNKEIFSINKDINMLESKQLMFNKRLKFKKEKCTINMFDYVVKERIRGLTNRIEELGMQEKVLTLLQEWISDFSFDYDSTIPQQQNSLYRDQEIDEYLKRFGLHNKGF